MRKYLGKIVPIDDTDYFLKNPEFCFYLIEEKDKYFGDLQSDEARSLFKDFVKAWNSNGLDAKFYEGLESGFTVPRTRPAKKGSSAALLREGALRKERESLIEDTERKFESREEQWRREKESRRKRGREQKELLDEMFPKATGRDALREKKTAQRAFAREREAEQQDFAPLSQADLMGGGDSFADARRREDGRKQKYQARRDIKRLEMEEKLVRHKAAEDAKLDQFRALLSQGPIKIQKRSEQS
ncbi:hypothetical protein HOP50_18g82350 [Chloropicon primus]|uniref:Uncharacterized protein n=1 Tax=Chloropicon primus TaxID=1764295 RepID=A0A5B8N1V6_9CHLO|nr:hypothetical protein A3770_18p82120 [Chloropicon primus]UPR04890.1 hypothetical protein HOP50_18g82350 [Chloropicon primus]|eukprot:QDZ25694.1 hypothetical protein A3770_18p82120 [Chloropicon primus]